MYEYVKDRAFLRSMRTMCGDTINRLVQRINNDGVLEVRACLIGSGAKNLVTRNGRGDVDLDYNLEILRGAMCEKDIKKYVQEKFNEVLSEKGLGSCKNSTSCLTTKKWPVTADNSARVSIDLAIVRNTDRGLQRLICEKTGIAAHDRWFWNDAPASRGLEERVRKLKEDPVLWQEVRKLYLDKKNMYLSRNGRSHPSYIIYIETINEIYSQNFPLSTALNFCNWAVRCPGIPQNYRGT